MAFLIETSNRRLAILILFYVIYLFFGALVFDRLESPYEAKIIKNLNEYVKLFHENRKECLKKEDLNEFIRLISNANDAGIPATKNVSKEQNWSFGQAVFFAGTVLSTIGYGNVSPLTNMGKIFCIIFALIGIPTTLLLLYAMIERLMKLTTFLLSIFTQRIQPLLPFHCIQRSHVHIIFALACALVVLICLFLVPAGIYAHSENWSYLNAFYYCFISLSTVGLGDYVPGDSGEQSHRHLYKIFSTAYLIFGVMIMVWTLEIFSQIPEFNIYKLFSLSKDGILTSHKRATHTAISVSGTLPEPASILDNKFGTSEQVPYQQQLNENLPLSEKFTD